MELKASTVADINLITEFLQTKNAWSSALGGGKILRKS